MNIFFLDLDPVKCAKYHVDRHAVKMQTEACQLCSPLFPNGASPFQHTHINHPMAVWVRSSLDNYLWALDYAFALCDEYTYRYEKNHKTKLAAQWYADNIPDIPDIGFTNPPRCYTKEWKGVLPETDSLVDDYRLFYAVAKRHLFKWKKREQPDWLKDFDQKALDFTAF